MLHRLLALFLLLSATPALAHDYVLGEVVFLKPDAHPFLGKRKGFDPALIRFPASVQLIKNDSLWLGRAWVKSCDVMGVAEAERFYTQLVTQQPESPAVWGDRAAVMLAAGNAEESLNNVNVALERDPHNPVWLVRRGDAFTALGLHDEAMRDYRTAACAKPCWPTALVTLGDALSRCGELDEAFEYYEQAKKADKLDPRAYFGAGNIWLARCDYEKAWFNYQVSINIDPFFTPAYVNQAESFYAVKRYDAAVTGLTLALNCDPTMTVALLKRARAWDTAGRPGHASKDLNEAVSIDPHNAEAQKEFARFLADCRDARFRNVPKAIEHASTAVALTGESDPDALAVLATAYRAAGDRTRAAQLDLQAAATAEAATPTIVIESPTLAEPNVEELPTPAPQRPILGPALPTIEPLEIPEAS